MPTVEVALAGRGYAIEIEPGLLGRSSALLKPYWRGRPLAVITDANVAAAQLAPFMAALSQAGISAEAIVLPAGEATKSWDQLAALVDRLLDMGVERKDHVIAFGGGVIGDLAGFAASIVKRGCNFIQIPTTLLSQVDSSVGGKTAINTGAGKNLAGAFHQPSLVLIDPHVLATLPAREMRAGYAEVIKYGLIDDAAFFAWCEANGPALLAGDEAAQVYAIERSVSAKARIVAEDERETTGRRALLNLGHTFGHALEAETGFSDRLLHGEAVAIGMVLAFQYSERLGLCPTNASGRIIAHLKACGMKAHPAEAGIAADGETLIRHMAHDKKMEGGKLPFLLARGIGETYLAKDIALDDVARFLDEVMAG